MAAVAVMVPRQAPRRLWPVRSPISPATAQGPDTGRCRRDRWRTDHRSPVRVHAGDEIVLTAPPPADPAPQAEDIPLDILYEDDAADRHRQAGRHGGPSRPRHAQRHAGQRPAPPLRRQPHRHRRRQAARHRPPARQGHLRASWSPPRPRRAHAAACRPVRRSRPHRPAAPRLHRLRLGPHRSRPRAPSTRRSAATPTTGSSRPCAGTAARRSPIIASKPAIGGEGWDITRLRCELETGRTHQIRVHMAHIGHPLVADPLYASGFATKVNRLPEAAGRGRYRPGPAGAARGRTGFEHPVTGEEMVFEAAPAAPILRRSKTALEPYRPGARAG